MPLKQYPLAQQLLFASANGDLHKVLNLLKEGATIAVNKHGRTALHIAAHRGFLDIVRALLQAGCNPDLQDDNGDGALHRAVNGGHEKVVERLLHEACDVDQQNNLGDTALHDAARCGYSDIVKALIKANANVHCKNKNLDLPLHMACANGHVTSVQQLLYSSATSSPLNKQKDTPLHLSVRFGHCNCTRLLIGAAGCDVNVQNEFGNTALHIATATRRRKLVRTLLDANAEAQRVHNQDGKSPLDLAKDMEDGELVLMLVSGARPPERKRSRSSHKSLPIKYRSQSDPRHAVKQKSSSEECVASPSTERSRTKIKTKRLYPTVPNSHRYHRRSTQVAPKQNEAIPKKHNSLEDHHRNLTSNPYVVPQLYALHRDKNGDIRQSPVIDHLPNPTPRIVDQLHRSIHDVKEQWAQSLNEATASLTKRIEDMQNETEHRLKSLDRITSERINAERTLCLHRIDRRASYERAISEEKIKHDLQTWMENRIGQNQTNSSYKRPLSADAMEQYPCGAHPDTPLAARVNFNSGRPLFSTPGVTESEVRSLDSGVGGTPGNKLPDPLLLKRDVPPHNHHSFQDTPNCSAAAAFPANEVQFEKRPVNMAADAYENKAATSEHFWQSAACGSLESGEITKHHRSCDLETQPILLPVDRLPGSASYVRSSQYYPSAEEELYERVLERNLRDQRGMCSSWLKAEEEDLAFIQKLQNISLAKSHAV